MADKLEWQRRYEHERDIQTVACKMQGVEPPKEEKYGELHRVKGLYRKFDAAVFWPLMESMGHITVRFEECKCY